MLFSQQADSEMPVYTNIMPVMVFSTLLRLSYNHRFIDA